MKYIKSIIGDIGFVDTKNKFCFKEAIKKIPKNARIMEAWEFMKLIDEDFESLKNIPWEWYFTYATKEYYRACRLDDFGYYSRFVADDRLVDYSGDALRGVLIVKRKKK